MMLFSLFFIFTLNGIIISVLGYSPFYSQECAFTKTKRNSCLYFVMREDYEHEAAANYCFDKFNGALSPIYYDLNETYEVMGRYYWWEKSDMNVKQIRFGSVEKYARDESGAFFTQTAYNPLQHLSKDIDLTIWYRSFLRETTTVFIKYDNYDSEFPLIVDKPRYVSVRPKNLKWSKVSLHKKVPFVCEVPRFPKIFCEDGWVLHMKSRSCFFLHTIPLTFEKAAWYCRASLKSNLASINDETENNMALRMIRAVTDNEQYKVWFGLRHNAEKFQVAPHPSDPGYAKYFALNLGYNVDGTPVSEFNYFDTKQPDGVKEDSIENCILFEQRSLAGVGDNGIQRWHDYNCLTTEAWSLCRKMASTEPF